MCGIPGGVTNYELLPLVISWLEISATRMHPQRSVLRYGATLNKACLFFPPKNVALGSCFLITYVGVYKYIYREREACP